MTPHEADLPAEPYSPASGPWISGADEDACRSRSAQAAPNQGSQAPRGVYPLEVGMTTRTGCLRRTDRILRSREFRQIARLGRRVASRDFVILVSRGDRPDDRPRLGITVSRKVGNAVVRNRVKRCVREWFRTSRDQLESGTDILVIARRSASELPGPRIASCLTEMLEIGGGLG
jgi:ribonuclease P protein component